MKLERLNDNQIRCTLTAGDLEKRKLSIGELAYCTEEANRLFHELMDQACDELNFDPDGHPVIVEAIPVSCDCLMLLITRVDEPEEIDSRFARFTQSSEDSSGTGLPFSSSLQEKESDPFLGQQIPDPFSEETPLKVFSFRTIDAVCALCASLPSGLRLESSLYKNPNSGQFLLLLKAAGNLPDYQSACAMACEHGTLQKTGFNPLPYFREHYTAVIPNGAVEALQLI